MSKICITILAGTLAVMLVMSSVFADDNVVVKRAPDPAKAVSANPGTAIYKVSVPGASPNLQIESILVVDDDGGLAGFMNVEQYYYNALTAAGYSYDTFDASMAGPTYAQMADYDLVIWFTGENWQTGTTLTATDESNLAQYLNAGGHLFLSAQDYFYDKYPGVGAFSAGQFPYDYLGVTSASQDFWDLPFSTSGVTGSFAEGMAFQCANPYSLNTLFPDMIVTSGAQLLTISGSAAACQFEGADFRTAFTTVSFEGLVDGAAPSTKAQFMEDMIVWMGATSVPGSEIPATVKAYQLNQNYPNPFNPTTEIRYQLPVNGKVTLTVYNMLGEEVATLVNGNQSAGAYRVTWNASDLPSGVYFYELKANNFQDVRKMLLLK